MSETTSFLGGAALAGLAAIILLKGGVSTNSPTLAPTQPLPNYGYPVTPGAPVATIPPTATGTTADADKQRIETEQLKALLEQQRVQTEQLKTQLQSQQALIETMNAQNKAGLSTIPKSASSSTIDTNPVFSNLLWMLGGVILTFGGGIALVGMFVLFAKQQRPSRTIEVVHDEYPGYLSNRRRTQMLPTRRTIKRVEAEEID